MGLTPIHPYGRFGLGILVGIVILAMLWYGSEYNPSMTPNEISLRILGLYGGGWRIFGNCMYCYCL